MSKFTSQAKVIVLALALALGISYVSAAGTWTGPTVTPPGGNVDTPINVGNNAQSKAGDLSVGAFLANLNSLFLGNVTIGSTAAPATLTLKNGSQGAGKVLTSDANGLASWAVSTGGGGSNNAYEINCVITDSAVIICFRLNTTTGLVTVKKTSNTGVSWQTQTVPLNISGNAPYSIGVYSHGSATDLLACIIDNAGVSSCKQSTTIDLSNWASLSSNPF